MAIFVVPLTLFFCLIRISNSVFIDKDAHNALQRVIVEFKYDPENPRFDHVILTSISDCMILPKIFIWCPIQHYKLKLLCPIHNVGLQCKKWLSELEKESRWNPRLVYDLGGNVIFVQRSYECTSPPGLHWVKHSYLSGSKDILDIIPRTFVRQLPIILHYRSAFTADLLDDIWTNIELGQNFLKISERMASLNFRKFQQRLSLQDSDHRDNVEESFYSNILYSFPSNDKLMQIFLEHFESIKSTYSTEMQKLTGTVLSLDHTFKVSEHISIGRNDNVFVKQFDNCLFVMNEYGEIVAWRLTKTSAFEEIQDLLVDLKQRHVDKGIGIEIVLLDDCCKMHRLYEGVFGTETYVKLDLFHACQRVIQTVDNNNFKFQFGKEFGLIFRCDGDLDEERQQVTPTPEIITANLEQFLYRWQGMLNPKTIKAIDDLRRHINSGCLSGILPGEGTEKNERFHRHLRRSLLVGANTISPELAVACLTVSIYVWNCRKKKQRHSKNQRVFPIVPPECFIGSSQASDTFVAFRDTGSHTVPNCFLHENDNIQHVLNCESLEDQIIVETKITNATSTEDLNTDEVFSYIIKRTLQLKETFDCLNSQSANRGITFGDFPLREMEQYASLIRTSSSLENFPCGDLQIRLEIGRNMETLVRNLQSFNLNLDSVVGDGNCCFHSITLQLSKLLNLDDEKILNYAAAVKGMGFGKSTAEDATLLRGLFIQELLKNVHEYKSWIDLEDKQFLEEVHYLKEEGTFSSNLSDLCVKVCSNVLGLPIVVITSYPSAPHLPFFPSKMNYAKPIYIAFNHTSPGHYDGTTGMLI
jgi:hypothetical protein